MRIKVEIIIPSIQQDFEATIPEDMPLHALVPTLFELFHEEYRGVHIYENNGKEITLAGTVKEANIVNGMQLYLM